MMEREVATVRKMYDAFGRRDWQAAGECFTADTVWHFPGRSILSGDYKGWDSILSGFFGRLGPLSGGTFRAELVDVLVGDNVAAAFQHATGRRNGKRLDVTVCQVMRFRDGLIADVRGHYSDLYHLDDFWS
jgi:ketosteroid isomerase-like protein